jgi:hypothetical protein
MRSWIFSRLRAKIRSKVPLYLAQCRGQQLIGIPHILAVPKCLRHIWQMNLFTDSTPPLPWNGPLSGKPVVHPLLMPPEIADQRVDLYRSLRIGSKSGGAGAGSPPPEFPPAAPPDLGPTGFADTAGRRRRAALPPPVASAPPSAPSPLGSTLGAGQRRLGSAVPESVGVPSRAPPAYPASGPSGRAAATEWWHAAVCHGTLRAKESRQRPWSV